MPMGLQQGHEFLVGLLPTQMDPFQVDDQLESGPFAELSKCRPGRGRSWCTCVSIVGRPSPRHAEATVDSRASQSPTVNAQIPGLSNPARSPLCWPPQAKRFDPN